MQFEEILEIAGVVPRLYMVHLQSQLVRKFWIPCYFWHLMVKSDSDADHVHKEIVVRGLLKQVLLF